jgi:fumarylacetoacetase
VAFVVGKPTIPGKPVSVFSAEEHIFGMVLFNDLSARDIQRWEYVPLGPFLGKNFASVVSPWIVTLDALEPFRVPGPVQDPKVLPYLEDPAGHHYDINLEIDYRIPGSGAVCISKTNHKHIYWNIFQQLAHHTVNGCNINVGDLCASGAISGYEPGSCGTLIELTANGSKPLTFPDGSARTFIGDHDTVIFRGFAEKNGLRVGFGEASVTVLPPGS